MALRRQKDMLAAFSMASMTDVIFLLLVFFMVTSTYVFPTAIDINLPEGVQQSSRKPSTRVFIDADGAYFVSVGDAEPLPVVRDSLVAVLNALPDSLKSIAVYADTEVTYGKVVEVLNLGAENSLKMVLATRPGPSPAPSATTGTDSQQAETNNAEARPSEESVTPVISE